MRLTDNGGRQLAYGRCLPGERLLRKATSDGEQVAKFSMNERPSYSSHASNWANVHTVQKRIQVDFQAKGSEPDTRKEP